MRIYFFSVRLVVKIYNLLVISKTKKECVTMSLSSSLKLSLTFAMIHLIFMGKY